MLETKVVGKVLNRPQITQVWIFFQCRLECCYSKQGIARVRVWNLVAHLTLREAIQSKHREERLLLSICEVALEQR